MANPISNGMGLDGEFETNGKDTARMEYVYFMQTQVLALTALQEDIFLPWHRPYVLLFEVCNETVPGYSKLIFYSNVLLLLRPA
jgi:hypothetical protein